MTSSLVGSEMCIRDRWIREERPLRAGGAWHPIYHLTAILPESRGVRGQDDLLTRCHQAAAGTGPRSCEQISRMAQT
eukprot:11811752-Prorocentrum_lima.AAC.1